MLTNKHSKHIFRNKQICIACNKQMANRVVGCSNRWQILHLLAKTQTPNSSEDMGVTDVCTWWFLKETWPIKFYMKACIFKLPYKKYLGFHSNPKQIHRNLEIEDQLRQVRSAFPSEILPPDNIWRGSDPVRRVHVRWEPSF